MVAFHVFDSFVVPLFDTIDIGGVIRCIIVALPICSSHERRLIIIACRLMGTWETQTGRANVFLDITCSNIVVLLLVQHVLHYCS